MKRRKINIDYIIIPTYYSKPDKSKIKFRKKFYKLYNILYTEEDNPDVLASGQRK